MSCTLPQIIQELSDHSSVAVDQYFWSKIFVICGPGGSRIDAVTAWLDNQSVLTNRVDNNWRIDVATGKTALPNYNLWFYDRFNYGKQYDDDLYWLSHYYRPQGLTLCQKHHNPDHLNDMLLEELRPKVTYVYILPSREREALVDMVWEFAIKTLLQPPWRPHVFGLGLGAIYSKQLVLETAYWLFHKHVTTEAKFSVDVKYIDYLDIVGDRGSRKLCELLGFETSETEHEIWQRGVRSGRGPDRVEVYGDVWTRQEFGEIYDDVIKEYASRQFLTTG